MLRAKRLAALEADTITAWRTAWEQSAITFERHMRGLDVAPTDVYHRLKIEQPHLSDDDVERECAAFLVRTGVLTFAAFAAWFKLYKLPDLDATRPDLSMWPCDVPRPPDELPSEWARTLPYMASEDAIEQLSAQGRCTCLCWQRREPREMDVRVPGTRDDDLEVNWGNRKYGLS